MSCSHNMFQSLSLSQPDSLGTSARVVGKACVREHRAHQVNSHTHAAFLCEPRGKTLLLLLPQPKH